MNIDAPLAAALLIQAGIPPEGCDCDGQCGCQYSITEAKVTVHDIRIVDHNVLKVLVVKGVNHEAAKGLFRNER